MRCIPASGGFPEPRWSLDNTDSDTGQCISLIPGLYYEGEHKVLSRAHNGRVIQALEQGNRSHIFLDVELLSITLERMR